MKVEIINKGDDIITVTFKATSPLESTLMNMATLGEVKSESGLQSYTGPYDPGSITFAAFSVPVIELMRKQEPPKP